MGLLLKLAVIAFIISMLSACASLGIEPPNFADGTWSDCTFIKKDGTTFKGPLQLGGAPMEFTDPDGIKIKCVPMPAAALPTPEPA